MIPGEEDYDDDPHQDDCGHEEFEIDILEGRAQCWHCGHAWYATTEQIESQERHEREYAEWEYDQARQYNVWWRRLGRWIYHHLPRWSSQEIPF